MSAHASLRIRLEARLDARIAASGLASYNAFGMIATEAAWRTGDGWLDALLPYLAGSRDILDNGIERAAPGARSMRLDATYLAWVDFSGTGLPAKDVAARVKDRARIFASPGRAIRARRRNLAALQLCHAAPDSRGGRSIASMRRLENSERKFRTRSPVIASEAKQRSAV